MAKKSDVGNNKTRGNYYEVLFKAECLSRNMPVSTPEGAHLGYDLIVDGQELWKVQVKGTRFGHPDKGYTVTLHQGGGRKGSSVYSMTAWDFLAMYVDAPDIRCWYVIPRLATGKKASVKTYPSIPHSKGQFEPYKNAFHLL